MSKQIHSEIFRGYAVLKPGGKLAINEEGMPHILRRLRDAGDFRKELAPHVGQGKVVRVAVEVVFTA